MPYSVLGLHLENSKSLVSHFKNWKCLGLTQGNDRLDVSQSLDFTIRHPYKTSLLLHGRALDIYILLDVSVWSIAVYFYEFCCILTSHQGESKYKQRVKIYGDTSHRNI